MLWLEKLVFQVLNFRGKLYSSNYQIGARYRRIYHYHIRKSAGTSLNSAFWNLAKLDLHTMQRHRQVCKNGLVFVRHHRFLIEQGHYFYANSHRPAYQLNLPEDTFTITILRNPVNRVISYYGYLLYLKEHPEAQKTEPFIDAIRKEFRLLGNSFEDFLNNVPRRILFNQLFMFSKHLDTNEALERILNCSAVCFTESFSQDIQQLSKQLNLPLTEKQERKFIKKNELYSTQDLNRLRDLLDSEFILLDKVASELNKK